MITSMNDGLIRKCNYSECGYIWFENIIYTPIIDSTSGCPFCYKIYSIIDETRHILPDTDGEYINR